MQCFWFRIQMTNIKKINKVHELLNHKNKEQMFYAYENAGKMDTDTRKRIEEVVENCKICKTNS